MTSFLILLLIISAFGLMLVAVNESSCGLLIWLISMGLFVALNIILTLCNR